MKLVSDGIVLVYEEDKLKMKRNFSMDKYSGEVRIVDTDLTNDQVVDTIRCNVFDLISCHEIEKYIKNTIIKQKKKKRKKT